MAGPQLLNIMVRTQLLNNMVGPQLLNNMVGPQLLNNMVGPKLLKNMIGPQLLNIMAGTQLNLFQNLQILSPSLLGMMSSTLQPHFLTGVYYDNGDSHIHYA